MEQAPKVVSQEEVVEQMEAQIKDSIAELEDLLPKIGHSEAKRLLLASAKYPMEEVSFKDDQNPSVIRANSILKSVKDALVALGVEVVIDQMLKTQFEQTQANTGTETKEETNV